MLELGNRLALLLYIIKDVVVLGLLGRGLGLGLATASMELLERLEGLLVRHVGLKPGLVFLRLCLEFLDLRLGFLMLLR